MPKLSPNDPAVRALELSRGIAPYLPDINAMSAAAGGLPVVHQDMAVGWSFATGWQWQKSTQMTFAGIATNVGIPVTNIFRDVADLVGTNVNEGLDEAAGQAVNMAAGAAEKLLDTTVMEGIGWGVNLMSVIPVAGAIVKMVWNVGKMIRNIVSIVQQSREEAERLYPPTVFNPQNDALVYNQRILNPTRQSKDWTDIFSPPGWGIGEAWQPLFHFSSLEGGGVRIMTSNPTWLGFVPGSGYLHQSIEVRDPGGTLDTGQYLPTARDQGAWLWKHIQKGNLPSMFTVDAAKARLRWERYLMDLWVTLWETKEISDSTKRKVWDLLAPPSTSNDGALFRLARPRAPGGRLSWGPPKAKLLDLVLPIHELRTLEKRQSRYLNTTTVAYLDKSYAAISGDTDLREKWELRRGQLLKHPARCEVSLDDVPDPVYEMQLRDEGVGTIRCRPARFKGVPGFARIPLNVPRPHGGLPGSGAESIPAPSRRRPSGILPLAAAAAAAGGIWYLSKRRRRA